MSDQEKMEAITEAFVRALIKNKFEDKKRYIELARRMAALIDCEVKWNESREWNRMIMQGWGPEAN